jgi:hypothetical protein
MQVWCGELANLDPVLACSKGGVEVRNDQRVQRPKNVDSFPLSDHTWRRIADSVLHHQPTLGPHPR